jgi:hypothetical protein
VSTDVAVGQMRAIELHANAPGDWAVHCHKSHHTMNAMGHSVRTYIGANLKNSTEQIKKAAPGYMAMGQNGMGAMGDMEMRLPPNTLPMMTGSAQFGPVEMGGMFTVMKVRPGLAADDYRDPGWYNHPPGTLAYEWTGEPLAEPARAPQPKNKGAKGAEFQAVDPRTRRRTAMSGGHENH